MLKGREWIKTRVAKTRKAILGKHSESQQIPHEFDLEGKSGGTVRSNSQSVKLSLLSTAASYDFRQCGSRCFVGIELEASLQRKRRLL